MPITQDRMLALLQAAEDYQQAWEKVQHAFAGIDREVTAGRLSVPEAWSQVQFMLTNQLQLTDPAGAIAIITREREHFRLTKRRNIKTAERQRQRRAGGRGHGHGQHFPRTTRGHAQLLDEVLNTPDLKPGPVPSAPIYTEPVRQAPLPAVGLDSDLDFGGEEDLPAGGEITPGYVPQELSPERKAEIDAEAQLLREQQELLAQLGRATPKPGEQS